MTRAKGLRTSRAGDVVKKRASGKIDQDIKKMKRKNACKRSCFCKFNLDGLVASDVFERLRSEQILHDIVLVGTDSVEAVTAHKLVLLNLGAKFQKLYQDKKHVGFPHVVNVQVSGKIIGELVRFAYNGKCTINQENLGEMLKIARELDIPGILKLGANFVLSRLSLENAINTFQFAKETFCSDVIDKVRKFILQNFCQIAKDYGGLDKCSLEEMEEFMKDDELNAREEELFELLVEWAASNEEKLESVVNLLKHVRFTLMNPEYFEKQVENSSIASNKMAARHVIAAKNFFQRMSRTRSVAIKFLQPRVSHKARIPSEIVFAIGGWSAEPNGPTSCIETFDVRSYKWNTMKFTATSPRAYHGLAMAENKIYLFGGYDGEEYFSAMTCYDPTSKVWEDKAPMYHARCYVSAAVLNNKIYALGGFNGRTRLSSLECYDPHTNLWTLLPSMRIVRSDASAVAYDDKIYVIGGFTGEEILDSVEIYDPEAREWLFGPRLNTVRSGVKSVVYQNKIYVMGGFDGHDRLKSVECLDMTKPNQGWYYVSDLTTQRSNFSLTVVDDKILVMGGFEGSGVVNKTEVYCGHTNSWTPYPPMNMQRSALSAVTLSGLPNSGYFVNRSVDSD